MFQFLYSLLPLLGFSFLKVTAYPILSENNNEIEHVVVGLNSFYSTILIVVVLSATFLAGCLCCKRKKGFQEFSPRASRSNASNIEFSNPLSVVNTRPEITLFPPSGSTPITFDPLPPLTPKHQPSVANPRPAAFTDALTKGISVQVWFQEPQDNFPRQQLHYLRECGRGWFGRVVEGEARGILPNGRTSRVIVRILREGATESEQKFFLHEAKPYMELNHPNVLRLLGRCLENDPFLLLFEACNGGDLKSWLTQNVTSRETLMQQGITMRMSADIASGLAHMNHHGFVHTDLAARNVLITSDLRAKVGDYGTSIEMFKDDYYCFGEVALPIRWCAPETLLCTDTTIETKEVTAPANVWSFGVVLWEIYEFGKLPYSDLSDEQVIVHVLGDSRVCPSELSFPSPFKNHLYYLMQLCWRSHKERPSISHILSMLNHLLTSKIKTQNDMDDFERRWENMKPNTVPRTDNHLLVASEERLKSDNDSGVVVDSKHLTFAGSDVDLSGRKLLAESSSSMTISPQLSVTSSSGGEFFSQTSSPVKLKSPSLQNLPGSLDDISEAVNQSDRDEARGINSWLQNIEIKNEKDAKLISGVYEAINDLDNVLSLEKTSSSNDSSCYDSPSSNRKSSFASSQTQVIVPNFKLGPFVNSNNSFQLDRRLKFQPDSFQDDSFFLKRTGDSSGTDTEDEIWRKRIERGEFSEKVKEKSKSIADLMVLTHIDNSDGSESDSLPSFNFGKIDRIRPNTKNNSLMNSIGFGSDICIYSSLTNEQSERDLKKFQNALKNKDMDDPSLNFLRRDSLSYFINNPNFKVTDLGPNSSSNFPQTDHFLEIRASEKTNDPPATAVDTITLAPEILISGCDDSNGTLPDELEIPETIPSVPKKFKFVFKDVSETVNSSEICDTSKMEALSSASTCERKPKTTSTVLDNGKNISSSTTIHSEESSHKASELGQVSALNTDVPKTNRNDLSDIENKIFSFELGDSGIIIDEQTENSQFILPPILCDSKDENLSTVILGSREDFTLDFYKGLKTCSGGELNSTSKNDEAFKRETMSLCDRKNKINETCSQENHQLNAKNYNKTIAESEKNNTDIFCENSEHPSSDCFVLGNCNSNAFTHDNFYDELSDDAYIDSGKSSDVLDDDNCDLKPHCCFNYSIDDSFPVQELRAEKNSAAKSKSGSWKVDVESADDSNHGSCTNNEDDFEALKLLTPDDEKSSDTGFRDKSSLSGSCDEMCSDPDYNVDASETDSNDFHQQPFIQCPKYFQKTERRSKVNNIKGFETFTSAEESGKDNLSPFSCCNSSEFKSDKDFSEAPELKMNKVLSALCSYGTDNQLQDLNVESVDELSEKVTGTTINEMLVARPSPCDNNKANTRHQGEVSPPSYEECERIHGPNFQMLGERSNGVKNYDLNSLLSRNLTSPEPDDDEYTCRTEFRGDWDPDSSVQPLEVEESDHSAHRSTKGFYLHSRSRSPEEVGKTVHSSWLPEPIEVDENGGGPETVSEEYLLAIRNELNEKLSKLQLSSLKNENDREASEDDEEDDDVDVDDDEDDDLDDHIAVSHENVDSRRLRQTQGNIFIQYNNFPEYLSPILEEDENHYSSVSSSPSSINGSDSSKTLSLNFSENETVLSKYDSVHDSGSQEENKILERNDIIEINTETNQIRIIESPPPLQDLVLFSSLDPTSSELSESVGQYSEYSIDSFSPVTGSPSATNPNALSFSSLNGSLSEVFLSPNSTVSDVTFADDKTVCSEPALDCEMDLEEFEIDPIASIPPTTEGSIKLVHALNETFCLNSEELQEEVVSNIHNLLSTASLESGLQEMIRSAEISQSEDLLKSVLFFAVETSLENWEEDFNTLKFDSFKDLSSLDYGSFKTSNPLDVDSFRACNSTDVDSVKASEILESEVPLSEEVKFDCSVKNKCGVYEFQNGLNNNHKQVLDPINSIEFKLITADLPEKSQEIELSSTIAFETKESETRSSSLGTSCSDSTSGNVINSIDDSTSEKYKNYCRKKFKITKVDETIKPVLFNDSLLSLDSKKNRSSKKDETNLRSNRLHDGINSELEISAESKQAKTSLPISFERNKLSSMLVSPLYFVPKNSESFTSAYSGSFNHQSVPISFIDSNSSDTSDTEEITDPEMNLNVKNSGKKDNGVLKLDSGDFFSFETPENATNLKMSSGNIVKEDDVNHVKDEDDEDDDDDEDAADFVPSSWNSSATPNKSVLKSPEQEPKSGPKKNVSFKRQRYHCVYEYPREEQSDSEHEKNVQSSRYSPMISFDLSAYSDWDMGPADSDASSCEDKSQDSEYETGKLEEKHNVYSLTPVDKDFSFIEDDEFFISSSTRPFKNDQVPINCQFFPGETYLEENFNPLASDINNEERSEKCEKSQMKFQYFLVKKREFKIRRKKIVLKIYLHTYYLYNFFCIIKLVCKRILILLLL